MAGGSFVDALAEPAQYQRGFARSGFFGVDGVRMRIAELDSGRSLTIRGTTDLVAQPGEDLCTTAAMSAESQLTAQVSAPARRRLCADRRRYGQGEREAAKSTRSDGWGCPNCVASWHGLPSQ